MPFAQRALQPLLVAHRERRHGRLEGLRLRPAALSEVRDEPRSRRRQRRGRGRVRSRGRALEEEGDEQCGRGAAEAVGALSAPVLDAERGCVFALRNPKEQHEALDRGSSEPIPLRGRGLPCLIGSAAVTVAAAGISQRCRLPSITAAAVSVLKLAQDTGDRGASHMEEARDSPQPRIASGCRLCARLCCPLERHHRREPRGRGRVGRRPRGR
mmetsp:Transcript_42117/g.99850  ORF Transcript_42117/g.99850 Transcript_42117/m.99850 type:complete len:213 (-) Transcript_42117:65-703(-)